MCDHTDRTVILDQTEECCSSCDIEQEKDFNAREPAKLLLTAIKELQEIFSSSEEINEDYLVSWLQSWSEKGLDFETRNPNCCRQFFYIWKRRDVGK